VPVYRQQGWPCNGLAGVPSKSLASRNLLCVALVVLVRVVNSTERRCVGLLRTVALSLSPDAASCSRRCCFCGSGHAASPDDVRGPLASRVCHSHPHATDNPHPAHQRCPHAALGASHHEPPPASHDSTHRSVSPALPGRLSAHRCAAWASILFSFCGSGV